MLMIVVQGITPVICIDVIVLKRQVLGAKIISLKKNLIKSRARLNGGEFRDS